MEKRIIEVLLSLLTLILFSNLNVSGQSIQYYQQEKIVNKYSHEVTMGTHHKDGIFIAFNDKVCYDCDIKGYDVGNGVRRNVSKGDKIDVYIGDSYWGHATYKITKNRSRLNIETKDLVYVYTAVAPPSGKSKSNLIRKNDKKTKGESVIFPNKVDYGEAFNNRDIESNNDAYYKSRYNQMEQSLISSIQTYENYYKQDSSSASGMIIAIQSAQRNMAEWRNYALQQGVVISKSSWEDVHVSPGIIHYIK